MYTALTLISLSFFVIFHTYFGYALTLIALKFFKRGKNNKKKISPFVTLIITAFNEEKRIKDKLDNSLQLDFPKEKLQIIVASDGSTDKTNEIVRSYSGMGIELLEMQNRGGKENAQKEAVCHARGDILVFSDVATILELRGILEIISNFSDPSVGCVSSEDRLIGQDGKPSGEGIYIRYEMWLRRLESHVNSLVGLSGSFFAARKEVCLDFSGEVQSDFRTLLNSVKLGLRGISDPEAVGYYFNIADEKREFERKVRTVIRGLTVFFGHLEFLNPFRYGLFAYQIFCHKLLRWLVPLFLITALLANLYLAFHSGWFQLLFLGQLLFYGLGLYGWNKQKKQGIFKIPMFFLIANTAILVAWFKYLRGERIVCWTPSKR